MSYNRPSPSYHLVASRPSLGSVFLMLAIQGSRSRHIHNNRTARLRSMAIFATAWLRYIALLENSEPQRNAPNWRDIRYDQ